MSGWRTIWAIEKFGWRREWSGLLLMLASTLYVGALIGFAMGEALVGDADSKIGGVLVDWMYMMMFSVFGMCSNRTTFRIFREDFYTRKIACWRTMPIPLAAIVGARIARALVLVPGIGFLFLLLQYGFAAEVRARLSLGEWLAAGWLWICYGLAMSALLIWLELGVSGKRYMIAYWAMLAVIGLAAVGAAIGGVHLIAWTIDQASAAHYAWLPVFTLAAAAALFAGFRLTQNRMRHRSYYF